MHKFVIVLAVLSSIVVSNITLVALSSSNRLTTWEDPVNLSNNTVSSMHPAAASWKNYVHVVWEDAQGIRYNRSSSSGCVWEEVNIPASSLGRSPAIAVWQNYVHIVWVKGNFIYYLRSSTNGSSWDFYPKTIISAYCSEVRIALNETELYIVWHDQCYIRLANSSDNGDNWSPAYTIAYGYYIKNPAIACWNDSVYVAWQESEDLYTWDIYCSFSTDKGLSWTERRVTNTLSCSEKPAIAANETDAWIVWQDNRDGNWEIYWANLTALEQKKLTTTSGDSKNPAIAVNDTGIYVVWSDSTPGNFEIYLGVSYNGITWDCERVTYTNICVSDCPTLCLDNTTNIFWHDNLDGDFDIYYTRPEKERYQLKLECEINSKELNFNSSVNYTIILKNLGSRVDNIELRWEFSNQQVDTLNWSASLNLTALILEPRKDATVNLTVTASTPDINSKAYILVIAHSNYGNIEDSIETVTSIIPIYNLALECEYSSSIVEAGGIAYYTISVQNRGNRRDNVYLLDLIQVSVPFGWDSSLSDYELVLEHSETKYFYLCVKAPEADKGIAEVKVRALSKYDSTKRDYVTTYTGIKNFTIDLSCDEATKYAVPGATLNYTINVWNLVGSGEINFELNTTLWNASLSEDRIYLATGAKSLIYLYLKVPENAISGECLKVNLTSKLENYTGNIILTAIVAPIYNITAIYNKTFVIEPGKNESLNLGFKNNGNVENLLKFKLLAKPPNWEVSLSYLNFSILPNELKYLEILIFAPRAASAEEEYYLELNVSAKNVSFILNITIEVAQYYDFNIACEKPVVAGAPNTTVKYNIEVENLGNGKDIILLISNFGWLENTSSVLNLSERKNISVRVHIPFKIDNFSYEFELLIQSCGNNSLVKKITLKLILLLPDFKFADIKISNLNPKAGEEVRIRVGITNEGNITMQNVLVSLYENDALFKSEEISVLMANELVYLWFTWYAKPGSYMLRIELDPENRFPELNEDNNVFIQKFEVSFIEFWNIYLYIVVAIAVAIAITLGLRELRRRSKKAPRHIHLYSSKKQLIK
ncbi:MAG: CARDB domain-containing protein [Candidatus Thermoplasmatota archaeon]|nr:CARDB domain-containing protein [Candidatus Thermoplasmatota archaeon]